MAAGLRNFIRTEFLFRNGQDLFHKKCLTAVTSRHRHLRVIQTVCGPDQSIRVQVLASPRRSSYSTTTSSSNLPEIIVQKFDGLPVLSIPMPSRNEKCRFLLKPLTNNLSDLMKFLKLEDSAINHVSASTEDGQLIPGSTSIQILLLKKFYLDINKVRYFVVCPEQGETTISEHGQDLSNVKNVVAHLYRAICSEQYNIEQQRHLVSRLEEVKMQLEPMEKVKAELHMKAARRTHVLSWVGLSLMGIQFGFLARLTWWDYSWDVMEPVTYFVTSGTAMAMFAYHLMTTQDYSYPDAHDRELVLLIHQFAKKENFDIIKYNKLRSEKALLEYNLDRLRHPLEMRLNPPHIRQTQCRLIDT